MYGHINSTSSCKTNSSSGNFNEMYKVGEWVVGHIPMAEMICPSSAPLPAPLIIPGNEFESAAAAQLLLKAEVGYSNSSGSSGCSSYGSPTSFAVTPQSQSTSLIQRSVSSHSLQKNASGFQQHILAGFLESETSPVRRALSTGDLQRMKLAQHNYRVESPLSNEINIIENMTKACRYSPEEKKERIERYRSKRNLRNFNKKIKYACRKTLADSRPRIRGRFAKNDETERQPENQWSHIGGEEDDEDDENWINFLEVFSANLIP